MLLTARQHKEQDGLASACDSGSPILVFTTRTLYYISRSAVVLFKSWTPCEGVSTTKYQQSHAVLLLLLLPLFC